MSNTHDIGTAMRFKRADFPQGFQFGTATSSYQIEGRAFGGCGLSHWDSFAATPGNTARGEDGAIACDHYHSWPEDLDLVRDANFDAYRFSVSWARIQPDGSGGINAEGLDFYDRLVDGMLERGLKPFATLYHWDLPLALAHKGGWQNRDIADHFADYTAIVMRRLGDRLEASASFNEPWCIAWLGHFIGEHAPGLRDISAAAHAMHHVLLAHGRAVEVMRGLDVKNIGVVMNFEYVQAADDSLDAHAAAKLYDGVYNRWFLDGVFNKTYPEDVLTCLGPYMPRGFEKDFHKIGAPVDWLGINYYTRKLIGSDGSGQFPGFKEVDGSLEKTSMGWEIYPEGLYHFITLAHENYTQGLPIHITENGMSSYDNAGPDGVMDLQRINYLNRHLEQVRRAIAEGVPVASYFVWSLLDNFEWALGYDKRFGLVHVDFETLVRTPKASWAVLQEALAR